MSRKAALAVTGFVAFLYLLSVAVVGLARLAGGLAGTGGEPDSATVVLVSIDGFRHDYLGRVPAPTLERLAAHGVRAERLIPAHPSVTFPNHTTLVTGLRPAHHGIVGNEFWDPERGDLFSADNAEQQADPHWWRGEPIWAAVERQGGRAMVLSWPGVEAPHGGRLPSRWSRFDGGLSYDARIDTVLAWLALPADQRPSFLTLYFDGVDGAGHRYGPDARETADAIAEVDRALGRLVQALEARGQLDQVDLVVVSDHGMTEMAADRLVRIDERVPDWAAVQADIERVLWDEPVQVWPSPGREAAVLRALRAADLPHVRVVRRDDAPEALHVRGADRVAPILLVSDEGWSATTSAESVRYGPRPPVWGSHGFDPRTPSMGGLLIARGPSFRQGVTVGPVDNVHVYALMAHVLGIQPARHDGDLNAVIEFVRRP